LNSTSKKFLFYIAKYIESLLENNAACKLRNIFQILIKRPTRFYYDKKIKKYKACEKKIVHYFLERKRGFALYNLGLKERGNQLAKSYFINRISFKIDDLVFDCGANYGDLYIFLKNKINSKNYIAFEPGINEFSCLKLNCPESKLFKNGLGNQNIIKDFYIESKNADSSFIKPRSFNNIQKVEMKTLDSIVLSEKISKVKLLKLEAEGFEPEVLKGGNFFLSICEFVAIDGGHERGIKQEETFSKVTNHLFKKGFNLLAINFSGGRALFKRRI
tara:strand:- start:171 stop:992 length:822 start_codon:yes stop_codon:yes gene_type:complete